ncbi:magnesium and cobalt transport protein CorA [Bordetella genomosp. 5]|uniref:Magnesium transporter n=1 Tax=Bordetella genomosp. 5 TaxID=1395608 RepID=A0A261TA88_9BORD|nr:magnesium and cobalt transport protein CorA [Bordetella genomosp. 5]OZI46548.1 magnesium transporter [Bordetella genomosp. 5]
MPTDDHVAPTPQPATEVVASVAYQNGRRAREVPLSDLGQYATGTHDMLWIGLRDPSPQTLAYVADTMGACDKNREEMLEPHRRPKIIDYGNMVLVVAITVEVEADRPVFGETQYLIGDGFLVTVRRGALSAHTALRERLEAAPEILKRGSDYVVSELLDWLVDRYVVAVNKLEHVVENAEQKLLIRGAKDSDIRRLYRQRRDLLRIHNAISPLAEICRRLSRVEMSAVDENARPYFGEVADRVLRVDELISALREALAFAFEASLMIGQGQQNDTTRKLASWAAILAVPTAIAGIYGMNFEYMPELKSPWGYPVTLATIAVACSVLYWRFRRSGWL